MTGFDVSGSGYQAYSVDAVAPDTFVAAQEQPVRGTPFGARVIAAEDDSEEIPWLIDQARGVPCALASLPGQDAPFCLPNPVASQPIDDDACPMLMQGAAAMPMMRSCPPVPAPTAIAAGMHDPCDPFGTTLTLLDATPASCGAALDPSTFSRVQLKQTGTGRLQVRMAASADGHAAHAPLSPLQGIEQGLFFDAERNEACSPYATNDGMQRCLPASMRRRDLTFFADSGCSVPVATFTASAQCPLPPPSLIATPALPSTSPPPPAPPIEALYRRGTMPMSGTIYVISGKGGGCVDAGLSASGLSMLLLEKLDLASFPIVTERVE